MIELVGNWPDFARGFFAGATVVLVAIWIVVCYLSIAEFRDRRHLYRPPGRRSVPPLR